jgi:hypothetical protein
MLVACYVTDARKKGDEQPSEDDKIRTTNSGKESKKKTDQHKANQS